ncbi:hypothetical protein F7725_000591 [Dissostichus mawsoni]|uniref:TRAF3-interacting JNK-activating modulator n=1 Tax=Dissostichus mawsoni TaxID=36200 RepID=A0A7J5ZFB3_DISMA|nr:hypothetical protein F7725_000591 [Dissostichus mawsoni]
MLGGDAADDVLLHPVDHVLLLHPDLEVLQGQLVVQAPLHLVVRMDSQRTVMDALPLRGSQLSPEKPFDQKVDLRAEKREYLRGRNNVTSCRSPTRELNTRLIKNELKEKRHLEFLRRRSVSPEPSGFVTVKESDLQRLTDYLQEALWKEEAVRKKLAALQESTSNLVNSSSKIWTARCSEDLLRNKIKALEAQLQVSLQKFPKDGVKRLVIQMEKQKMVYEERALVTLQKVTQEKTEALCKAETLQEALIKVNAESLKWQSLYEELKLNSVKLQENQHLSDDQLQQLHSQAELSRGRESGLRQEVVSLRQENKDLHIKSQDLMMQERVMSEEAETRLAERRDSEVEKELLHTQEKLQLKERECEELQTELHAVEQECKSSQARLSQCRDELRQLSHHRRRPTRCGSCWKVCLFLLFLLAVAGVAMLWLWHPPFREQVEDLYSDIETHIEDYLMDMASPQHSGCFRPI